MRKKVIISSSDRAICRLVKDILREKSVEVYVLAGPAGRELPECGDIIILDGPSGVREQVLRCPRARFIVLTDSIDRSRTADADRIAFVQKPFAPSHILDLVDLFTRGDQ